VQLLNLFVRLRVRDNRHIAIYVIDDVVWLYSFCDEEPAHVHHFLVSLIVHIRDVVN